MSRSTTGAAPRLTAADAIAIASERAADEALAMPLTMAMTAERDGRLVWIVRQPAVGRVAWVEVDDATGLAGPVLFGGLR